MASEYRLTSNRESGEGRFDIQLMPKSKNLPGIIIEVKAVNTKENADLRALAKQAITQIHQMKYATELKTQGVNDILLYGIAFKGKQVELAIDKE